MVGFLLRAAISALGLWVASLVLPGISFESPGKLAIAELAVASREDVEELERAGIDAVLVSGDVAALVGDGVPDV